MFGIIMEKKNSFREMIMYTFMCVSKYVCVIYNKEVFYQHYIFKISRFKLFSYRHNDALQNNRN